MIKKILLLIIIIIPITSFALELTSEEQKFIKQLGTVNVCVDPDWEPYEKLNTNGEHEGLAADLVKLIFSRTGIKYRIIKTVNWDESIEFSKKGKCEVLSFLNKNSKRDQWLIFTEPYFTDPNVIVTKEDHDYISDLAELNGESIVLIDETNIYDKVSKDYPNLKIIKVKSENDVFRFVSEGKADMTIRSLNMSVYTIKNKGLFNLKVAGEIPEYANKFRIGIVKEKVMLRDILNKGVATLTPIEVREILNRHVYIKVAYRINHKVILLSTAIFLFIITIGATWLTQMRKLNIKLKKVTEQLNEQLIEQTKVQMVLKESEKRYKTLLESAQEGIAVIQNNKFVYFNPSLLTITGYQENDIRGNSFMNFVFESDVELVMNNHIKRLSNQDVEQRYLSRIKKKDGNIIWVEISGTIINWEGNPATLNFVTDVSFRVEKEENVRYAAEHDYLTGLPNRLLLNDRINQCISLAKREKKNFAVIFIDLNKFKPVNDTYGHEAGDFLLKTIAIRLVKLLRESDTVARVGGDEFVILLWDVHNIECADLIVAKIRETINKPIKISNSNVSISCSVGIALYPENGETADALYKRADSLMYEEKNNQVDDEVCY